MVSFYRYFKAEGPGHKINFVFAIGAYNLIRNDIKSSNLVHRFVHAVGSISRDTILMARDQTSRSSVHHIVYPPAKCTRAANG